MTSTVIAARDLANSPHTRLDVRYHTLSAVVRPILDAIRSAVPMSSIVTTANNGVNLPASAYADDVGDADALYLSVGAMSQFALRSDACTPLLAADGVLKGTRLSLRDVSTADDELLITRSGTPGIAWPGSCSSGELLTVPSGFVIRAKVREWDTVALAAVLNHPVWRLNSLALSAGKRQDNISQATLRAVPLPDFNPDDQAEIRRVYLEALGEIEAIAAEDRLAATCDRILSETVGLVSPALPRGGIAQQVVSLLDVARAPVLRIDNRWHGTANRSVRQAILADSSPLGSTLAALPLKGRQPSYLDEPDGDGAFAIATSTIQMGQLALDSLKPVLLESIARSPVDPGSLIVAMDGDGSLGKAAVVPDSDLHLARDSHVAKLDVVNGADMAFTLACWLNSTWGLVQTAGLMMGSTGQTQLRPIDLASVLVSNRVLASSSAIASAYRDALNYVDTPTRRARKAICRSSAEVSRIAVDRGLIELDEELARKFVDPAWLWDLLELAYPSVRVRI